MNQYTILAVQYSLPHNIGRVLAKNRAGCEKAKQAFFRLSTKSKAQLGENWVEIYNYWGDKYNNTLSKVLKFSPMLRNVCLQCTPIF